MKRRLVLGIIAIVAVILAYAGVLAMGLPDPGRSLRICLTIIGLIGCGLGISWMRAPDRRTAGSHWVPPLDDEGDGDGASARRVWHPALEDTHLFAARVNLGATRLVNFERFVRPRLEALAKERLSHQGIRLDDADRARELLGSGYWLVDPARRATGDPAEPGTPVSDLNALIEALERL